MNDSSKKHAPRTDLRTRAANAPQLVESQWGLLFDRNGFSVRDKPDRIACPERGDFVEQGFTDAADVWDAVMLQGLHELVRYVGHIDPRCRNARSPIADKIRIYVARPSFGKPVEAVMHLDGYNRLVASSHPHRAAPRVAQRTVDTAEGTVGSAEFPAVGVGVLCGSVGVRRPGGIHRLRWRRAAITVTKFDCHHGTNRIRDDHHRPPYDRQTPFKPARPTAEETNRQRHIHRVEATDEERRNCPRPFLPCNLRPLVRSSARFVAPVSGNGRCRK